MSCSAEPRDASGTAPSRNLEPAGAQVQSAAQICLSRAGNAHTARRKRAEKQQRKQAGFAGSEATPHHRACQSTNVPGHLLKPEAGHFHHSVVTVRTTEFLKTGKDL